MGCSQEEFAQLIETIWNPVVEQKPFGKPVQAPTVVEILWPRLSRFHVVIVRQAMIDLLQHAGRPDLTLLPRLCAERVPASKPPMPVCRRYDISRVFPYGLDNDHGLFAKHVAGSPVEEVMNPEFYQAAIDLIHRGEVDHRWRGEIDWSDMARRYAERKAIRTKQLGGRTPGEWYADMARMMAEDRQKAQGAEQARTRRVEAVGVGIARTASVSKQEFNSNAKMENDGIPF